MPVSQETLAERVRIAMVKAHLSQQDLARILGVDPSAISRALSGKRNFKSLELALIAEALGTSVESLVRDGEPIGPAALAARVQPNASPVFEAALARVQAILDLDRLLNDLGYQPGAPAAIEFDTARSLIDQAEELADKTRAAMGVGPGEDLPAELDQLASAIEQHLGIDVAFEPMPPGVDGLSAACANFRLAIANSKVPATRQRYTLAHEVGHLMANDVQELHVDENVLGVKTVEETRANAFAASFLMPAPALRNSVLPGQYLSEQVVADLLGRFRVSLDALAFRLHNVGLADARTRDRIRLMSSKSIALRSGRAADLQARNDRRAPENLLYRAIDAYVDGKISVRPLATLLNADPEILLQELSPPPSERVEKDDEDKAVL